MSPQPERAHPVESGSYTPGERALLVGVAHAAIESAFEADDERDILPDPERLTVALVEPRGAFTTLHLEGKLRGCVGYVQALKPLVQTVAETAVSAAFYDPRFLPVTREEARRLKIEISVLSLPRPVRPEEVAPGVHGLIVSQSGRRGLLLPQVATEYDWDAETLLQQTCLKAGLPPDAWRHGATLEAFTAEVFGEE